MTEKKEKILYAQLSALGFKLPVSQCLPHGATHALGTRRGENIHYIHTAGSRVSFNSHTLLLTEQNDLAVFDYSTRKTCTNTCNVKHVGRPE